METASDLEQLVAKCLERDELRKLNRAAEQQQRDEHLGLALRLVDAGTPLAVVLQVCRWTEEWFRKQLERLETA